MKKELILILMALLILVPFAFATKNPAAVYCEELGYNYKIEKTPEGDKGVCVINEQEYDAWKFFIGEVAQEYSYCSKVGMDTVTLEDGKDPFSEVYGACLKQKTPLTQETTSITEMMELKEKVADELEIEIPAKQSNAQASATPSALPSSFDWRNYQGSNWITSIKDQGACGSCWAFATVAAVESNFIITMNNPSLNTIDLSEQYLVSDCCSECGNCNGGGIWWTLDFIEENGISDEACFPYSTSNNACSGRCYDWSSRLYTIDSFKWVGYDANDIKQALIEEGPLIVTYYTDGAVGLTDRIYRCGDGPFNPFTYHAVLLIGYDDEGDYWKIKNSWGITSDLISNKIGYGECEFGAAYSIGSAMKKEYQYGQDIFEDINQIDLRIQHLEEAGSAIETRIINLESWKQTIDETVSSIKSWLEINVYNSFCSAVNICSPPSPEPVPECTINADCAENEECTNNKCVPIIQPPAQGKVVFRTNMKNEKYDLANAEIAIDYNGDGSLECYRYYSYYKTYRESKPETIVKTPAGNNVNKYGIAMLKRVIISKYPNVIFKPRDDCTIPLTTEPAYSYSEGQEVYK